MSTWPGADDWVLTIRNVFVMADDRLHVLTEMSAKGQLIGSRLPGTEYGSRICFQFQTSCAPAARASSLTCWSGPSQQITLSQTSFTPNPVISFSHVLIHSPPPHP